MVKSFDDVLRISARTSLRYVSLGAAFALAAGIGAATAGEIGADQIVNALKPKPRLTRSLSGAQTSEPAANPAEAKFVNSLRNRTTRSLSSGEREQIAAIAQDKPNIDLEITFDYNSDRISSQALAQAEALGKALSDPALKGSTFVVAGHTDAAGSETYNQDLSERRAETIKRFLTEKYGVDGSDLVTVGYGESKLKDTANPNDPANRRVQVVTMANKTASK